MTTQRETVTASSVVIGDTITDDPKSINPVAIARAIARAITVESVDSYELGAGITVWTFGHAHGSLVVTDDVWIITD